MAEQRQAAVHVVGQPVSRATGTAAAATLAAAAVPTNAAAATPTVARRPGRPAEFDQTQVAHAATAGEYAATPAAAASSQSTATRPSQSTATTPPSQSQSTAATDQQHADAVRVEGGRGRRRRMERVVVVVAAGHHAGHGQQAIRLWPGTGQPASRGHAETVAAAHTGGAQGFHAVRRHTAATAPQLVRR